MRPRLRRDVEGLASHGLLAESEVKRRESLIPVKLWLKLSLEN